MSQREVRYCTTEDGARIAYCVEGEGPTTILALPALNESFALDHLMPVYQQFYLELGRGRRLVRFDWRGMGLSSEGSAETRLNVGEVHDLAAVVAAVGGGPVTVWAPTTSGPAAIFFATAHAELIERVVFCGAFGHPEDALTPEFLRVIGDLAGASWETATQTIADMNGRREFPMEAAQLGEWYARSETGQHFVDRNERYWSREREEAVPDPSRVQAPALVLHRIDDPAIQFAAGQKLAASLPNARFVPLQGKGHLFCLGEYSDILAAVDAFIGDRQDGGSVAPRAVPSGTAVILFTDIVDSTELTEQMGDAAFRAAARALDTSLREAMTAAGGMVVTGKVLGDGVMGVFSSAAQAIEGARRCLALSAASELGLHIGVHAGDVIREEGNVFGGAVNIAARICGLSAAGEILVSDVVRGMARSSAGVVFEDRGEQEMKGVGEPVRVYAVVAG